MKQEKQKVSARWSALKRHRDKFITIAEDCSKLTVPTVFPEMNSADWGYDEPMDGFGARAVNNLASKLMLTLFPPTHSFFRLNIPLEVRQEIEALGDQGAQVQTEVDSILSAAEQRILQTLADMDHNTNIYTLVRSLIVTGGGLLWLSREDNVMKMTTVSLRNYVVRRSNHGRILELIVRSQIINDETGNNEPMELEANYDYTHVLWDEDNKEYNVYQGTDDTMDYVESYSEDELPFIVPRWNILPGESYSVGLCGEHIGDLRSLEACTQAITNVSAITARIVHLVNPAGYTNARDLAEAKAGDYVPGAVDDVTPLIHGNPGDFQITLTLRESILQNLSHAFLLTSSIQRQAERVTAEEIRLMASELEAALGGVYSMLAGDLVRPLIKWVVAQLKKLKYLPSFPKDTGDIEVTIVTGFDALSRTSDFMKYQQLIASMVQLLGPEVLSYFKPREIIQTLANAQGLDVSPILKSDEELQQEQAAMLQMQAAQQGLQQGIEQGGANGATA